MDQFFFIVQEGATQLAPVKYASEEEARYQAEVLARKSGMDVYILKPFAKASVHRVEWEDI